MSAEEVAAARICPPNDMGRTANDFACLKFTGGQSGTETTHAANEVPAEFCGRWVDLIAVGGDVHFAFSESSSAEVDRAVAATAAGASSKVGGIVLSGTRYPVQIPNRRGTPDNSTGDGKIYFVRESSAVGTVVYMIKSGY
jgi:hypothetical protein